MDFLHKNKDWHLESSVGTPLFADNNRVATYNHNGFRLITCKAESPLYSLSVVVPTLSWDNSGLAHTLEHLVFCESRKYKKGYLDHLANISLSNGTNAYTSEDHTCYTAVTASLGGLLDIIPVYMDHILCPVLSQVHFSTEVFSVESDSDGETQKTGVVYSEMASRVYEEADILDRGLRELTYGNHDSLSYECGGIPGDIETLTLENVIKYHEHFYSSSNISVVISGKNIDDNVLLHVFKKYFSENNACLSQKERKRCEGEVVKSSHIRCGEHLVNSVIRHFPSGDEDFGSVGFSFDGPSLEEFEEIVSLNILLSYFCELSSSVVNQHFVECAIPMANSVDFEVKMYNKTSIFIVFGGVPHKQEGGTLCSGRIKKDLLGIFKTFCCSQEDDEFLLTQIKKTIERYYERYLSAIEEEPHDIIYYNCLYNIMSICYGDADKTCIGTNLDITPILDNLKNMKLDYWKHMVDTRFINTRWNEVVMVPQTDFFETNKDLADSIGDCVSSRTNRQSNEHDTVVEKYSRSDFPQNRQHYKNVDELAYEMVHVDLSDEPWKLPFCFLQQVETRTEFFHFTMCLDISGIDENLRVYLVLLQELLFSTDALVRKSIVDSFGFEKEVGGLSVNDGCVLLPYQIVDRIVNENFISLNTSIGFGNSTFSCSSMGNLFVISGTCRMEKVRLCLDFLTDVLFGCVFTSKRILTVSQNLYSQIIEIFRNGPSILDSIATRYMANLYLTNRSNVYMQMKSNEIENSIGIFQQLPFTKSIIEAEEEEIRRSCVTSLEMCKTQMLCAKDNKKYIQIVVPVKDRGFDDGCDLIHQFLKNWNAHGAEMSKMTNKMSSNVFCIDKPGNHDSIYCDESKSETHSGIDSNAFIYGVEGIITSYFSQYVMCDVFNQEDKSRDYHAVSIICQCLSMTEGPLYSEIRGSGLAYDASMSLKVWNRLLVLSMSNIVDPVSAFVVIRKLFVRIIDEIDRCSEDEMVIFSDFNIEMSKTILTYQRCSSRSTPSLLMDFSRKYHMMGFRGKNEYEAFDSILYSITRNDILVAFKKYFLPFVEMDCLTVLVCDAAHISQITSDFSTSEFPVFFKHLEQYNHNDGHED